MPKTSIISNSLIVSRCNQMIIFSLGTRDGRFPVCLKNEWAGVVEMEGVNN